MWSCSLLTCQEKNTDRARSNNLNLKWIEDNTSKYGQDCGASTIPGPVGFEEGGVVDNGRKQGGEGPQEEGGEELSDDRILQNRAETWVVSRKPSFGNKIPSHQQVDD